MWRRLPTPSAAQISHTTPCSLQPKHDFSLIANYSEPIKDQQSAAAVDDEKCCFIRTNAWKSATGSTRKHPRAAPATAYHRRTAENKTDFLLTALYSKILLRTASSAMVVPLVSRAHRGRTSYALLHRYRLWQMCSGHPRPAALFGTHSNSLFRRGPNFVTADLLTHVYSMEESKGSDPPRYSSRSDDAVVREVPWPMLHLHSCCVDCWPARTLQCSFDRKRSAAGRELSALSSCEDIRGETNKNRPSPGGVGIVCAVLDNDRKPPSVRRC